MIRFNRVWKLYIVFIIVLLTGMTAVGFMLEFRLKGKLKSYLTHEALILANVIAATVPQTEKPATVDSFCRKFAEITGVRVTIIKTDGSVIGESDRASIGVDNHLKRKEVREAIERGTGVCVRLSKTLGIEMLYVASLMKGKGKIVRTGIAMTQVNKIESEVMGFLSLALFLTPVLAIVISFFFARYMADDGRKR